MFSHLYMVCLRQSQHWEASCRKQTSVERKTEPMEILKKNKKKNKFPYSTGIHVLTLIDGYHRLRHS